MAVGDVLYYPNLREGRRQFRLRPATYLVLAKGNFNEDPPEFPASAFGAAQLFFGYGASVQKIDEAVAYLGPVPASYPTHYSEPIEGGGISLEAVIEVEDRPQPGRLVFQAITECARFENGKLVIMEVKIQRPPSLVFVVPLSGVTGIEPKAKVKARLRKPWQGKSKL